MWRNPLGRQRRAARAGDTYMLGQERLDAVGAQSAPMQVGEQGASAASLRLVDPGMEGELGVPCQWGASFLPAFAVSRARAE